MTSFADHTNENKTQHNMKWPYIPDHPYRILIIGGSGSGKIYALLNSINNQPDIDKIYLYVKDPYEPKHQFLINKRESSGLKQFIGYSNDMQDVCKNVEEYNINKKRQILIVFDEVIADMISNEKLNSVVSDLFGRRKKLNTSLVFVTQS